MRPDGVQAQNRHNYENKLCHNLRNCVISTVLVYSRTVESSRHHVH